jgi:hypothetical protein
MQVMAEPQDQEDIDEAVINFVPFNILIDPKDTNTVRDAELTLPATSRLRQSVTKNTAVPPSVETSWSRQITSLLWDATNWFSRRIQGRDVEYDHQELHTRLILGIGGLTQEQLTLFEMFVDGAKINALVSAGCRASDLPTLGIGMKEWRAQAGFGAKELAALGASWSDMLAMGFTTGMMFTDRKAFGPHILVHEPFRVTFEVITQDMGDTLDTLVRVHKASSSDLSLLGVDWTKFKKNGGDADLITCMGESVSGMESNLQAKDGEIHTFMLPNVVRTESSAESCPAPLAAKSSPVKCRSFVM